MSWKDRRRALRELIPKLVLRPISEARALGGESGSVSEMLIVAMIGTAAAAGCAVGILVGRGRSPERVC